MNEPRNFVFGEGRPALALSWGLGVESTAILTRWLTEPASLPAGFALADVVVLTAQVGHEHDDTIALAERHILPLLKERGVRLVEVCRAGASQRAGVTVLRDTTAPERLSPAGGFRLADENLAQGVIPQIAGVRKCSQKFKGFPLDAWRKRHLRSPSAPNVALPCLMAFGFNADESKRARETQSFDDDTRRSFFPLLEWGWTRNHCLAYLESRFGVAWPKSACVFCPFNRALKNGAEEALARFLRQGEAAVEALWQEYGALCLNPRGLLFKDQGLFELVASSPAGRSHAVWLEFERRQAETPHALMEVKRIYRVRGLSDRSVIRLAEGSRAGMLRGQSEHEAALGLNPQMQHGIRHSYAVERQTGSYPHGEAFLVAGPVNILPKARGDNFWRFEQEFAGLAPEWAGRLPGYELARGGRMGAAGAAAQMALF